MELLINRTKIKEDTGKSQIASTVSHARLPILQVNGLTVQVKHKKRLETIIQDIYLTIQPGETVALVGESGSGKSMTAGAILGLLPKSMQVTAGQILYQGEDIVLWSDKRRRELCGSGIGYVFQDYQGSFTPFIKIGNQLTETIRCHYKLPMRQAKALVLESLEQVGLPAERAFHSYPYQLSGGQLQRAALAGTMMLQPALLIADEPTTALDVLTGERVLDLLKQMQRKVGCAVLFISHDLHHVMKRADHIAVMNHGTIIETGEASKVHYHARHPYTRKLLNAKPLLSEIPADFHIETEEQTFESLH